MQKLKGKICNSASLGKTVARGQTLHSKSFFVEPSDFDQPSLRNISMQQKKFLPNSTPKLSSKKSVLNKTMGVANYLSNMHQNRKQCERLQTDLHSSMIQKSIKINKLFRELHHFSICMQQVKWLLTQGDKLISQYLKSIQLVAPESTHTLDVSQVARQFRSLLLRFKSIDRNQLKNIEEYLKNQCGRDVDRLNLSNLDQFKSNPIKRETTQTQQNTYFMPKDRDTKENSFMQQRNFSFPMKQNFNNSNFATHFDNINLDQPPKNKIERSANPFKTIPTETVNVSKLIRQRQEWQKQKQHLYEDINLQHKKVEELMGSVQLLKSEIMAKDNQIFKYRFISAKSIQQLSQILKKLMLDLNSREKQFELLKMAQCINRWQKMNEEQHQEAIYQSLKGDKSLYDLEHRKKMQEIINLQYDINSLLTQKRFLQTSTNCDKNQTKNQLLIQQQFYKMLSIQAVTIEELCGA